MKYYICSGLLVHCQKCFIHFLKMNKVYILCFLCQFYDKQFLVLYDLIFHYIFKFVLCIAPMVLSILILLYIVTLLNSFNNISMNYFWVCSYESISFANRDNFTSSRFMLSTILCYAITYI